MKRHLKVALVICCLALVTAVGVMALSNAKSNKSNYASKITKNVGNLAALNTEFGFKLFKELSKNQGDKNTVISPTSVSLALSMALNGANGETKSAIAKTLGFDGIDVEGINKASKEEIDSLQNSDPRVKMQIANSLWANKDNRLKKGFTQKMSQFYNAKTLNLDFANPNTKNIINKWVSDKTNGKIPSIINETNANEEMYLVNAVYFNGPWSNEFYEHLTKDREFTLMEGKKVKVPMMEQKEEFDYYEGSDGQAINMPYGNGNMSMYIFLPPKSKGLKEFYSNLNYETWNQLISKFQKKEGVIALPKFKVEYDASLNKELQILGMGKAFSSMNADFSSATTSKSNISQVRHKTYINVNEKGTEAAAATSIVTQKLSSRIEEKKDTFEMIVDRPFFFAIRDNKTGNVLFMGSIVDPK